MSEKLTKLRSEQPNLAEQTKYAKHAIQYMHAFGNLPNRYEDPNSHENETSILKAAKVYIESIEKLANGCSSEEFRKYTDWANGNKRQHEMAEKIFGHGNVKTIIAIWDAQPEQKLNLHREEINKLDISSLIQNVNDYLETEKPELLPDYENVLTTYGAECVMFALGKLEEGETMSHGDIRAYAISLV